MSRRSKVVLAAVGIPAAAGLGVFAVWFSGSQQQHYDEGHAHYLDGDCEAAVEALSDAVEDDLDDELTTTAQSELDECEQLLDADELDTRGNQADALLAYSAFVDAHPASPLVDFAVERGGALVRAEPADRLATAEVCDALDVLEARDFVVDPAEHLPPILLACGGSYQQAGDTAAAFAVLDRARAEFPTHELAADIEAAFAAAAVADAESSGAGILEQPAATGSTGSPGDVVLVRIANASVERLTLVFSGSDARVVELPACADCRGAAGGDPCEVTGAPVDVELSGGAYRVVARATSAGGVRPFIGSWSLEAGSLYEQCFFISES